MPARRWILWLFPPSMAIARPFDQPSVHESYTSPENQSIIKPRQRISDTTSVFLLIWFGQLVSLIGSELTGFALGVWVYQRTGSALQFTLIALCTILPEVLLSPFAGALVDRWDRRKAMILSDSGSGLSTLAFALVLITGQLDVWHIYLAMAAKSVFHAFQWPAYAAATTLLARKQHLSRASGMMEGAKAAARILGPMLGGMLIATIHLHGVILIDFATFLFALVTLVLVRIPKPERTPEGTAGKGSLLREAAYGWTYIMTRPGLRALLSFVTINNLLMVMPIALMTPLVLSFTSASMLGTVLSSGGLGLLVGSLVMSVWGGPKRLVYGILGVCIVRGLCFICIGVTLSGTLIALVYGVFLFCLPIFSGCSQAIWQKKVVPDLQGRVFAVRRALAWSSIALAHALAGLFAEYLFEPLLGVGGPLASSVGHFFGVGPGRGIGLLCVVMGVLAVIQTVTSACSPRLLRVEEELPDVIT